MKRRTRRIVWGLGIAAGLFTAITAIVHIPAVQYAMGWVDTHGNATCPFGHGASRVAIQRAPQPALGFVLGVTTRDEVRQWATRQGVTCRPKLRDTVLECLDVPAALASTYWFELDPAGIVVTIKTARRSPDAGAIVAAFTATDSALAARAGAPRSATGDRDALPLGALRQWAREYRNGTYSAAIRATNMGNDYLLTERYSAL